MGVDFTTGDFSKVVKNIVTVEKAIDKPFRKSNLSFVNNDIFNTFCPIRILLKLLFRKVTTGLYK